MFFILPQQARPGPFWLCLAASIAWLVGAVFLCLGATGLPAWLLISLGCAELAGAFLALRRSLPILLGPVSLYDVIRTARGSRYWLFRLGYVFFLLLSLTLLYRDWLEEHGRSFEFTEKALSISSHGMETIANRFFNYFMVMQFVVVVLLTPLYAAVAITEEKERKTIDYLMTTHLHSYEIVLGKLASRLGSLLLLILAGLPVLSLILFFGGVSPDMLLAGFAATFVTALSLASFGVLISIFNPTTWDAVFRTYFGMFILFVMTTVFSIAAVTDQGATAPRWLLNAVHVGNPVMALVNMEEFRSKTPGVDPLPEVFLSYLAYHLIAAAVLCILAVRSLREVVLLETAKPPAKPALPSAWIARSKQPVGDDALMWKELNDSPVRVYYGRSAGPIVVLILWMATFLVVWSIGYQPGTQRRHSETLDWIGGLGIVVALFMFMVVTISGAGRFSREFERQTMESLLTVPDREHIFYAKWWGSLMHARALWWFQSWALAGCLLFRGELFPPFLATVVLWVYMAFLASLGLWFSLVTRSTVRSIICTPVAVLVILFASIVGATVADHLLSGPTFGRTTPLECFKIYSLTAPIGAWVRAFWGRPTHYYDFSPPEELYLLIGAIFYGGLAWFFYRLGLNRFHRLAGPRQPVTSTWMDSDE